MRRSKFSVILPVHNRAGIQRKALNSLNNQTFKDFELIYVDDGSTDMGSHEASMYLENLYGTILKNEKRQERVYSRNIGMQASTGEWICWLDSDDEYLSTYLETLNDAIEKWPEYRIFNFGAAVYFHRNKEDYAFKQRRVFSPDILGGGHIDFQSGHIGTGSFIFRRDILDEVELMKPSLRPYGDPGCFPELNRNPNYPMREDGQWIPMGNPWGDDYHWFWLITRNNISKPIDMPLYIQHYRS